MLLIKATPIAWAEAEGLVANIHHLALGHVINCSLIGVGDGDVRVGVTSDSDHLESILAAMLKDQLGSEPESAEYLEEMFRLRRKKPNYVLNLQLPQGDIDNRLVKGRDPLVSVYSALARVPKRGAAGVSWVLRARLDEGFDAHGVAFATGRDIDEVRDLASYVAAAYGALGFQHARRPLFHGWAWRSVLAVEMRKPSYRVSSQTVSQVWHPPIAEDS